MNDRRPPDDPLEWLNRAESSLTQASHPLEGVYLEDLCAAAHQAAEKAIKAVLLKKAVAYPYVHDLGRLLAPARNAGISFHGRVASELVSDDQERRARAARRGVGENAPGGSVAS